MKSRTIFLVLLSLMFMSCSPDNHSVQTLQTSSFTPVSIAPAAENSQIALPSGMRTLVSIDGIEKGMLGEPLSIHFDNCEGTEPVTKYLVKGPPDAGFMNIEVPQNVINELGGRADKAREILKEEIAAHLKNKLSPNKNFTPSVSKTIPPKSQISTTVQTRGDWVTGSITIIRQDGSYLAILPFRVLNQAMLIELDMTISSCNNGSVPPGPLDDISITTTPVFVETMVLPGNAIEGIKFTAKQSGFYIFNYVSGSYAILPVDEIPAGMDAWRTTFYVFLNRPAEWQNDTLTYYPEYVFGRFHFSSSEMEAENAAQGQTLTINLKRGDYLLFVPHDDQKSEYTDNPGGIVIDVLFVPK